MSSSFSWTRTFILGKAEGSSPAERGTIIIKGAFKLTVDK